MQRYLWVLTIEGLDVGIQCAFCNPSIGKNYLVRYIVPKFIINSESWSYDTSFIRHYGN